MTRINSDNKVNTDYNQLCGLGADYKYSGHLTLPNAREEVKVTFEKEQGFWSRVLSAGLAALCTVTLIPLIFKFQEIKALWIQSYTGIEIKTVNLAVRILQEKSEAEKGKEDSQAKVSAGIKDLIKPSAAKKKTPTPSRREVKFKEARARVFITKDEPTVVGQVESKLVADLRSPGMQTLNPLDSRTTRHGQPSTTIQKRSSKKTSNIVAQPVTSRSGPLMRKYPPISHVDTVRFEKAGQAATSAHGTGLLFSDEEIVGIQPVKREKNLGDGVVVQFTVHNKAVIQQQGTRGCTAATAAMLIMDKQGNPDIEALKNTNLGSTDSQKRIITRAGFMPSVTTLPELSFASIDIRRKHLQQLQKLIQMRGAAVVNIDDSNLGNHVIVVDEITDKDARVRDPYHGWEITITLEALAKRFSGGDVIQIE